MKSSVAEYERRMKKTLVLLLIFGILKYMYIFHILKYYVAKSMGEAERAPKFCLSGSTGMEGSLRYCSDGQQDKM